VVRRGDTFPGLGPDWLRMAVVAPERHDRIVDALSRSLADGRPPARLAAPARPGGGRVTLMAVGNLERIAAFLLDGGRRPGTPVACIQRAGTSRQQLASCSLGELDGPAASPRVDSPAVVVIGPTVAVLPDGGSAGPNRRLG
jgi:siroheme synthase